MSNESTPCSHSYETIDTLQTVVAAMLESALAHMRQCALVTLTLHFSPDERVARRQLVSHSTHYYLSSLRQLVRKTDNVYLLDSTCYFVLPGANIEGASIVQTRLWDALLWYVHNAHEANALQPHFMTIGHAAYNDANKNAQACIVTASEPRYSFEAHLTVEQDSTDMLQDNDPVILDTEGHMLEDELTALARKLGMPYLSLLPRKKPEQVQRLVTLKLARELHCYPLGRERGTLTVALSNPEDSTVLSRLHQETGLRIFPVLTHPQELQTALNLLV